MWRECGTPGSGRARIEGPERRISTAPQDVENFQDRLLTALRAAAYIAPIDGAPPALNGGVDAPAKLLTFGVTRTPVSVGGYELRRSFRLLKGRGPRSPGCLTSESEERETWTAESLRAASSTDRGNLTVREAAGRDFGGTRF